MNSNLDQALTHGQRATRFLARVGGAMARWAAAQGWRRLFVLSALALIAQHILTDKLMHWDGETHVRTVKHAHAPRKPAHDSEDADEDVSIGFDGIHMSHHPRHSAKDSVTAAGSGAATPTDGPAAGATGQPAPPAPPAPPAAQPAAPAIPSGSAAGSSTSSAASSSGGTPAPASGALEGAGKKHEASVTVTTDDNADEDDDEDVTVDVTQPRGFWRWVRDAIQGVLLLLIVYLVGAKIVLRQTARSDARAAQAEASAAASADAAEREALQRQLAEAQLQALQAQVEPHFLFNTLASVDYLIETDPARASAMQKNLIQYLRAALPQMRNQASQLGREADLSKAYLEILKMRMEDRLRVLVDVPDGLRSAEFPPMMLQTLVENAIQHGVEPKPEGGEVRVAARVVDGHLEVTVADSGVGLSGAPSGSTAGGGVGLANVRERLQRLYGGQASFSLAARPEGGAVATLRLPYRVAAVGAGGRDSKPPAAGGTTGAGPGGPTPAGPSAMGPAGAPA